MKGIPRLIMSSNDYQLLPRLLDAVDKPIIAINLAGDIIYRNRHSLEFFTAISKNGDKMDDIDNSKPSIMDIVQNNIDILRHGESVNGNFLIADSLGKQIPVNVQVSMVNDTDEGFIVLLFDMKDRPEMQRLKTANQILTEVDTILGDEVNYEAMLRKFVEFTIPQLADISVIHVLQQDHSVKLMAMASHDREIHPAINHWLENDLPNDEVEGLPAVYTSGESIMVYEVSSIRRSGKAGIKSYMILPMITHRQIRGSITFISTNTRRLYNQEWLEMAKNLAINVSIYLEKNRLYLESQRLKEGLEQRVVERTAELSDVVAQLKQSEQMIHTLFRISKKLNATLEVDQICDELAREAIHLVNGESGFAGLRIPEGMQVKKYFHNDNAIPFEHVWPIGEGIPGWVLKYKVPYGTSDAQNDPLIRSELAINENVRSLICTPILDPVGEVIGYFDIRNKVGAEGFTISDQEMLLTLAPVASIAIQNAILYQDRLKTVAELKESSQQLEDLAAKLESTREEERMRISRELHDQLGQSLTAIKFDLTTLTNQIQAIDDNLAHRAKDILTQLNTMIKTVRRISTELRPGMLEDLGLVASIEWQAGDFQKRTGIICHVNAPSSDLKVDKQQSLAIFRIFQEALTNVVRYANAKNVDINLKTTEDKLIFEFHDDGRGIREEEIYGGQSLGLLGMRERVKHVGGIFEIDGNQNQGTSIRVFIPLSNNK